MFRASLCSSSGEQTIQKKLLVVYAGNTEKNVKCSVFGVSLQLTPEIFFILRRNEGNMIENV